MEIRFATERDIPAILELLRQVNLVHHNGRPDIFNIGTKYTAEQLRLILNDRSRPILVADTPDGVKGYAFCILESHAGDSILTDIKTLYLDDLCVDENCRGRHIGTDLYDAVLKLARDLDCYNVTLNVWACNPGAAKFYEKLGMKPLKTYLETIIK